MHRAEQPKRRTCVINIKYILLVQKFQRNIINQSLDDLQSQQIYFTWRCEPIEFCPIKGNNAGIVLSYTENYTRNIDKNEQGL